MKSEKKVLQMLRRYFDVARRGDTPYFDAEDIEDMLDYLDQEKDPHCYHELLELGLRLHPDNVNLKIRQCEWLLHAEQYKEALALANTLHETNERGIDLTRLECYCALDRYPKAAAYLQKLIDNHCPYLDEAFVVTASALNDFDMPDEAQQVIDKGLTLFPNHTELKKELCYLFECQDAYERAIEVCNELIDSEPHVFDHWSKLARLYTLNNNFNNAVEACNSALACKDADPKLKLLKAFCLFRNSEYEKAIVVYAEITKGRPTIPSNPLKALVAECLMYLENYEHAYPLLKELLKEDNDSPADFYELFARACYATNRMDEALQSLLKATELFPDNIRITLLLGRILLEQGQFDRAVEIVGNVLHQPLPDSKDPNKPVNKEFHALLTENFDKTIADFKNLFAPKDKKPVPPKDLTKDFLDNLGNRN